MRHTSAVSLAPMGADFHSGWDKLWNTITGSVPGLSGLIAMIGVALIVWAIGKWFWRKRTGGGADSSGLLWTLAVGTIMVMPSAVVPLLLKFAEWAVNLVVGAVGTA